MKNVVNNKATLINWKRIMARLRKHVNFLSQDHLQGRSYLEQKVWILSCRNDLDDLEEIVATQKEVKLRL